MNFKTDKTRLLAALFALTVMPVAMTGCGGPTCGSGTEENDSGECVPTAEAVTCADGTILSEGTCVLDTTGCGSNTTLENGVCVPAETGCANGTTFNTTTSACEAAEVCGTGTSANDAGECVPAAGACAAGTTLNTDGICEVAMAACGTGTQLDVATGTCALADSVCGDNTVLANGTCSIIADACATGTVFNDATGTCTPEATCKPGDTIANGLCVTPAEVLFEMATVEIPAGNTNPGFDGTPVDITLPAVGTPLVIKGTIEAPFDHDSDPETANIQDVDVVKFTSTGGQIIKISAQPTDGSSVPMITGVISDVEGFDYARTAAASGTASSRFVILPVAGDYLIPVFPRGYTGDAGIGSDDFDYVLTVEEVARPTAALASAGIQGSLADLTDNFYDLDGSGASTPITFTFEEIGTSADVTLHFFNASNGGFEYIRTEDVDGDTPFDVSTLDPGDDTVIVFDWDNIRGTSLDYLASVTNSTNIEALGAIAADGTAESTTPSTLAAGESYWYSFDIEAGQFATIGYESDPTGTVNATVYNGAGQIVNSGSISSSTTSPSERFVYAETATTYVVNVVNTSSTDRGDFKVVVNSFPPADSIVGVAGDTFSFTGGALPSKSNVYFLYDSASDLEITGNLTGTSDLDLFGYDITTGDLVFSETAGGTVEAIDQSLPAGRYFFRLLAFSATDSHELDLQFRDLPSTEVEPNEDDATATPFSINSDGANGTLADTADVDVFSFTVDADQALEDVLVLRLSPDAATGVTPTYTCEVRDSATVIMTLNNVTNECVMMLKGLVAAETYYIDLRTDSATPVDYDVTVEHTTGQVEDPTLGGVVNLGSVPAGASIEFFGDLATDGANPTVDALSFKVDSIDAGQLLVVNVEPVYNRAASGDLSVEVVDANSAQIGLVDTAPYSLELDSLSAGFFTLNLTRADFDLGLSLRYKVTISIQTNISVTSGQLGLAIDDVNTTQSNTITVNGSCIISEISVPVDILHEYRGDMGITLTSPAGTTVTVVNSSFDSTQDYLGSFGVDFASPDLVNFIDEDAAGDWTMTIEDIDFPGFDFGTWNSWGLDIGCK